MAAVPDSSKQAILDKIAQSREEIRRVLSPAPRTPHGGTGGTVEDAHAAGAFPRSRTMRALLSGRGVGTVGAVVGGLIMARPALALKLLRVLPTGAVARMLMVKAFSAWRNR